MQLPARFQLFIVALFVLNTVGTYLSNIGAYGDTNKEVSEAYNTLITPPGYAFAIWALIFCWEGLACTLQCLARYREDSLFRPITVVGWAITCVSQVAWSIAFAQKAIDVSMAFIVLIWIGLLITTCSLAQSYSARYPQASIRLWWENFAAAGEWLALVAPFSLHFGWLSAAMCVNGEVLAVSNCVSLSRQVTLAIMTLAFLVVMVFAVSIQRSNAVYAAAVCWALFSLRDRNTTATVCTSEGKVVPPTVLSAALTDAATVLAGVLISCASVRVLFGGCCLSIGCHRLPTEATMQLAPQGVEGSYKTVSEAVNADMA